MGVVIVVFLACGIILRFTVNLFIKGSYVHAI